MPMDVPRWFKSMKTFFVIPNDITFISHYEPSNWITSMKMLAKYMTAKMYMCNSRKPAN